MPDAASLQPGQGFANGRFILIRLLGRGGMGEVWLARDERLRTRVALKFLSREIRGDASALDDLRRETARSHRLNHPNIVRIHDLHEEPDGMAFIVMEYVEGMTLAELRLQQPDHIYAWDFLRPLMEQLCAALDYAHGQKVIHRDLKPANMIVDPHGRLKLADFGIAAMAGDAQSRTSVKHVTSGTPPYMSPQQLSGKWPQVSDDIYALGATFYEALTSKPPFYSGEITYQVLNQPAEPMQDRLEDLELFNPIPNDVAAMVMACLAKEPAQRPRSAKAVAAWIGLDTGQKPAIEAVAQSITPASPPKPISVKLKPSLKKPGFSRKRVILAVTTFCALLATVAGLFLWRHTNQSPPHPAAQAAPSKAPPIFAPNPVPAVVPPQAAATPSSSIPSAPAPAAISRPAMAANSPQPNVSAIPSRAASAAREQIQPRPNNNSGTQFVNSLGMRFVSIPGANVLFSIWDTRVQDFQTFMNETGHAAHQGLWEASKTGRHYFDHGDWRNPGWQQSATMPVCAVNWLDAREFCRWLTRKESGIRLRPGLEYRLPTDAEWSAAVGLPEEQGNSPAEKDGRIKDIFSWGTQWPPPAGAGNFAGAEATNTMNRDTIAGYNDGFPRSSPVGSFPANQFGLYDMSGNVWQWCEDHYSTGRPEHVLRGGSWLENRGALLSSTRRQQKPDDGNLQDVGFRCVIAPKRAAETPQKIACEEAENYYDQDEIVKGKIVQVIVKPKMTFLNFDRLSPNAPFSAVIFPDYASEFGDLRWLRGKDVEVSGRIQEYQGKPDIVLESKNQITVISP